MNPTPYNHVIRAHQLGLHVICSKLTSQVCVACGATYLALLVEGEQRVLLHNHHCDPKREQSIENRRAHQAWQLGRATPRSFSTRLAEAEDLLAIA